MKTGLKILLCMSALLLPGCIPTLIIGGGGAAADVAAQERSPGHTFDDSTIYLKIKNLYAQNDFKDLMLNVDIKVTEGRVLLAGNVDKPDTQIQAVRLAWQVPGVKEIMNNITVNDKSGFWNYTRDVWISTQARTHLLLTKGIRSINYSVITVNQTVYLMGIAQDQAELDRATSIISTIPYVQRVVSYVRLKDDPRRPENIAPQ